MLNLLKLRESTLYFVKCLISDSKQVPWGKGEKALLRVKRT